MFPRVHLLLSHVTSRRVISGCTKLPAHVNPDRAAAAPAAAATTATPLLEEIVETVAQLLAYVPEPALQRSIVDDLTNLLMDLHDLNCLHEPSGNGQSRMSGPYKAELELLCESRELSLAAVHAHANPAAPPQQQEQQPPFLLNVTVGLETLVLEAAVMQILFRVSLRHQRMSMESVDDLVIVPCGPDQARRDALKVGRRFHQATDELDDLAQTLSSILGRPLPTPDDVASSAAKKVAVLTLRSKIAACDLLEAVVRDADKCELSSDAIVVSVATAVARACSRCLRAPLEGTGRHRLLLVDPAAAYWFRQYRSPLASLLLCVAPIRLGEGHGDRERMLHTVLRPHLLDAASYIVPTQQMSGTSRAHLDLEIAVLRLLHKTILAVDGRQATPVVPSQVAHRLVLLLDDPILSIPATFLLAMCQDGPLPPSVESEGLRKRGGPTMNDTDASAPKKRQKTELRGRPTMDEGADNSHLAVASPSARLPIGPCWKDQLSAFVAKAQGDSYRLLVDLVVPPQDETDLRSKANAVMAAIRLMVLARQPVPTSLANAVESLAKHVAANNSGEELSNHVASCAAFLHIAAQHRPDSEHLQAVQSAAITDVSFVDERSQIDPVQAAHLSLHLDASSLMMSPGVMVAVSNMSSIFPAVKRIDWFSPVTIDANSQRTRLVTLTKLTSQAYSDSASLSEGTVQCLNSTRRDHPVGAVRLLRWQCIIWLGLSGDPFALRQSMPLEVGREEILYFLRTAFADPSPTVREFASRHVGVLFRKGLHIAAAITADEVEWQSFCQRNAEHQLSFYTSLAARVFSEVDSLLHEYCSVPQSQLSFTVGTLSETKSRKENNPGKLEATTLQFRRYAMHALSSMSSIDTDSEPIDRMVFEESLKRVVGLLSSTCALRRFDSIGLGFGALSLTSHRGLIRKHVRGECLQTFPLALFRDVLMLGSSNEGDQAGAEASFDGSSHRESHYLLLSHFIQRFCTESHQSSTSLQDSDPTYVSRFMDLCLPSVVSQLVIEKDYGPMLLTAGFKRFVQAMNDVLDPTRKRAAVPNRRLEVLVDDVYDDFYAIRGKASKQSSWRMNLETRTRHLCLEPVFIEQILPTIFMKAGRSELTFFVNTVLQKKNSLHTILTQREQLILKGLVWEAGMSAATAEAGLRAIRAAAAARSTREIVASEPSHDPVGGEITDTFTEAADWVSSHFMYLLVNVVQINWSHRRNEERLRALRCLTVMLHFLKASTAPTFVPQFMASVNASIQLKCADKNVVEIRILAVRAMHQFLRIVARHQWESLGQYLTEIVVSLIPLLPENGSSDQVPLDEPARLAVSLLEWLTEASLGKKLAPFFAVVPFLPLSIHLDSVRSSLRKNGIDVDSLQVATSQGTQYDGSLRGSHFSDGVSISSDSLNGRRQAALQTRLCMMCSLLSNENANVRCVALKHIASLIRGNRDLFCELVTSESVASVSKFLTVLYKNEGKIMAFLCGFPCSQMILLTVRPTSSSKFSRNSYRGRRNDSCKVNS